MSTQTPTRRSRRWIEDWRPEDAEFWETTGRRVARRNLVWSIFAEHLGFSVWLIWSVSSAFLVATGFDYTPQQLFLLVALPNLVGSLLRLPYTFAVPKFGGRNWTMASAALLLIQTLSADQTAIGHAVTADGEHAGIDVAKYDLAFRTYPVLQQRRDVAGAARHVENRLAFLRLYVPDEPVLPQPADLGGHRRARAVHELVARGLVAAFVQRMQLARIEAGGAAHGAEAALRAREMVACLAREVVGDVLAALQRGVLVDEH